jgi:hypothetical protein
MTATGSGGDGATAAEYRLRPMRLDGRTALAASDAPRIGAATSRRPAAA